MTSSALDLTLTSFKENNDAMDINSAAGRMLARGRLTDRRVCPSSCPTCSTGALSTIFTMAQSFWDAAAPLISATERHPFLVSMVDGTLNLENFQFYVIQDALYLTDFAACLHLLGDKMADVNEEVSKRLHRFAVTAEEDEKELHRSFFKRYIVAYRCRYCNRFCLMSCLGQIVMLYQTITPST